MTEREKVDLLREGYAWALRIQGIMPEVAEADAAIEYPFPKRPREVVLAEGASYRIDKGKVQRRSPHVSYWSPSGFTPDDLRKLGELAANPTEDDI